MSGITIQLRQERAARADGYVLINEITLVSGVPVQVGANISRCFVIRRLGGDSIFSAREVLERVATPQDLELYPYNPLTRLVAPSLVVPPLPQTLIVDPFPGSWASAHNSEIVGVLSGAASFVNAETGLIELPDVFGIEENNHYLRIVNPEINRGLFRIIFVNGGNDRIIVQSPMAFDGPAGISEWWIEGINREYTILTVDPGGGELTVALPFPSVSPQRLITVELESNPGVPISSQALPSREFLTDDSELFRDSVFYSYYASAEATYNASIAHQKMLEVYVKQLNKFTNQYGLFSLEVIEV